MPPPVDFDRFARAETWQETLDELGNLLGQLFLGGQAAEPSFAPRRPDHPDLGRNLTPVYR